MSKPSRTSRIAAALAAVLLIDVAAGSSLAVAQQTQATPPSSQTSQPTLRACRVKEHAGGKTCTANVTEGVCAAIAKEASGTYSWTADDCP